MNCACSRCKVSPIPGDSFVERGIVLCSECWHGLQSDKVDPSKPPLQMSHGSMPAALLNAFNRYASLPQPVFRVPSKALLQDVPWEDLEMAFSQGLLCATPIGRKSTFAHREQKQWLHLCRAPDRDIVLAPREPDVTPELVQAILRFNTFLQRQSMKDIKRIATSVWGHKASAEEWQSCAEASGIQVKRSRGSRGHESPFIETPRQDAKQPLDFERFAFGFFKEVNGQVFYSTNSLAESMLHYGRSETAGVPADICYKLVELARQSGHVRRCESDISSNAMVVQINRGAMHVPIFGRRTSGAWEKNEATTQVVEEREYGEWRVQLVQMDGATRLNWSQ